MNRAVEEESNLDISECFYRFIFRALVDDHGSNEIAKLGHHWLPYQDREHQSRYGRRPARTRNVRDNVQGIVRSLRSSHHNTWREIKSKRELISVTLDWFVINIPLDHLHYASTRRNRDSADIGQRCISCLPKFRCSRLVRNSRHPATEPADYNVSRSCAILI